ncbi:MAG: hypothetical protein AAB362_00265 [Patescibacteria group bacterium]
MIFKLSQRDTVKEILIKTMLFIVPGVKKTSLCLLLLAPLISYAVTIPNPLGDGTSISMIITRVTDFLFSLGLAIAVIVFLVGGFQYLFSFGSEQKTTQARNTLMYGVVGTIIMLVGKGVTALIVSIIG